MKMPTAFNQIILFLSALFLLAGCSTDDTNSVPRELRPNDFVWKGLNLWYLWQDQVPDLGDDRFANQEELNSYLRGYSNPSEIFNALLYQKGTIDKFSVIYSDYTVLEQVLTGNVKNNGVDFVLLRKSSNSDEVIGWVRYVLPNSDASGKDIHRGDIFYAVNGTSLTTSNYQSLLGNNSYTLSLADYDGENFTPNGREVSLTKFDYSENPVFFTNVYTYGPHKIGYLVYNGFYGDYEPQLNAAFATLKSQGVTDFVLDLRYNSGGLISTSANLASMITGQFTNQVFAKQIFNSKINYSDEQTTNLFTSKIGNGANINHLNLNRVFVLTTSSTASASELVINGLKPYINVIQIGGKTVGKNVGSVTLYDSPNFSKKNLNPDHKYAMQPLVLKVVNKNGFGDYQTGLLPDIELYENLADLKPLGSTEELFLAAAIAEITGSPRPASVRNNDRTPHVDVSDSKQLQPLRTEMYLDELPEGLLTDLLNK